MYTKAVTRSVLQKKTVLKNFSIFTEKNLCCSPFLNRAAGPQTCNFIKNRLQHRYFPVNIAKFLRTSILENICERLLLYIVLSYFIIKYNFIIITYLILNLSKVFSQNIYFGDCSSFRGLKIDAGFKYHISVFLSFTEIERISKLNFCKNLLKLVGFLNAFKATLTPTMLIPAGIYLFEVNNGSTIKICEIFSNLIIKTRSHW